MKSKKTITYRPDIDGLRAVAVLSVVAFHAFPEVLKGGFIGVDVFFVISGYLISLIIFQGIHEKSFSFASFYARRICRIFPALILVLTVSLVMGWFYLLPDEYEQLGKHTTAGAGFFENFVLRKEAGYFDSELKPLLHLWSLSVEEQYYLLYPLIIFVTYRLKLSLLMVISFIFICSLSANVIRIYEHPEGTFYFPYTRFWELLAGAILAYLKIHPWKQNPILLLRSSVDINTVKSVCSFLGLTLLLISALSLSSEFAFPGAWAILPVLGSCLIIFAGSQSWVNRRFLSSKFMVFIGLISYPLYLWHWPLLTFGRIITDNALGTSQVAGIVFISFLLAAFTQKFVENPIRFGKKNNVKSMPWINSKVAGLVSMVIIIGSMGHIIKKNDGLPARFNAYPEKHPSEYDEHDQHANITIISKTDRGELSLITIQSINKKSALFVGDSNAHQYYPRVSELIYTAAPHKSRSAIFFIGSGCFPAAVQYTNKYRHCKGLSERAYEAAKERNEIDTVIYAASWNEYFANAYLSKSINGFSDTHAFRVKLFDILKEDMKKYIALGKKVYLVLSIPNNAALNPKRLFAKRSIYGTSAYVGQGVLRSLLEKDYGEIQRNLELIAGEIGVRIIDPKNFLCDKNYCPAKRENGAPIYFDGGSRNPSHLDKEFTRCCASFIDELITGVDISPPFLQ
jgi:peptidoglycan/LPS O-acetylase OafA/YrhL